MRDLQAKWSRNKEIIWGKKWVGHFSLGDDRGISGGLPDADQEIPN